MAKMHTETLNFLRLTTFILRILLLLASVLVFGVFTYFISTRADHEMGFPKWISAVEGLSGVAMIYSLVMTILTLPYGGRSSLATVAMVMDVLFIPAFTAIAIMNRKVLKSCEGEVDTALGKGSGRSEPVGFGKKGFGVGKGKEENIAYMVRFDTACKLQKAAFYTSIASIIILLATLFSHYYYNSTFRTARREGLPSAYKGRSFGLWPFGHSAADEEKAFQERIKSYTAKGFSNRPDDVPVERPIQGRGKEQYQRTDRRRQDGGGGEGKVKHFFSKMMPGRNSNSGRESDEEPLQAQYQYPHHDMKGDKYFNEGNTASEHGDGRVQPGRAHDDGNGHQDIDLNDQPYDEQSNYATKSRTTTSGRSPSEPTSWADRKRKELEAQRQQRAGGYGNGNGQRFAKVRQLSAANYADGVASPRQQAAQKYAEEQKYADRAKGTTSVPPAARAGADGDGGGEDPRSAASRMKQQIKKETHSGQDKGQQQQQPQPQQQLQQRGNEHGIVHRYGTGKQGQQHGETADGPRKAGPGAGALRDTPYGPKDQAPGAAMKGKGVDQKQARRAYGY